MHRRINKYKQKHIPKCYVKVHAHMTTPTFLDVLRTTRACLKNSSVILNLFLRDPEIEILVLRPTSSQMSTFNF